MLTIIMILLCIVFSINLVSCSDNESINEDNKTVVSPDVRVKEGYLCFANQKAFDNFMECIRNEQNSSETNTNTRAINNGISSIEGFQSISSLSNSIFTKTRGTDDQDDTNEQEMTQDEYNVMVAENILKDPLLSEVMDTTLRIEISENLYKITDLGTFYTDENNSSYLQYEIDHLDTTNLNHADSIVYLGHNVKFLPSIQDEEDSVGVFEEDIETRSIDSASDISLHSDYNTKDYKWKNHSIWQKFWDRTRGKDVCREREFDKKHRVKVEVFSVNYGFYTSAGIKVEMQKRKKFLFIKYWVKDECQDLAIGFNMVTGTLKFKNPASYSSVTPTTSSYWKEFKGTINNIVGNYVYQRISSCTALKDWINPTVDKLYMILPEIRIKNPLDASKGYILEFPDNNTLNNMYNAPYKEVCSILKKINGNVFSAIEGKIKPEDPRIAYMVWGESIYNFDKAKPYITGVKTYGTCKSKVVYFNKSFGFSYNGIITPFTPSKFTIDYFDGFGSVKYNNKWLGIRFIGKSNDIW